MSEKSVIEIRFFGARNLLHSLIANETLKPIRQGNRVIFSLGDVAILAARVSELENILREVGESISVAFGESDGNDYS